MRGAGSGMPMQAANKPLVDLARRDGGFYKVISPSYFSTLGIKPIKGRLLADTDTSNSPPVLVLNERMVKRFFPDEEPVGQRLLIQKIVPGKTELGSDIAWEVVGVIGDEKIGGPDEAQSAAGSDSMQQIPV